MTEVPTENPDADTVADRQSPLGEMNAAPALGVSGPSGEIKVDVTATGKRNKKQAVASARAENRSVPVTEIRQ